MCVCVCVPANCHKEKPVISHGLAFITGAVYICTEDVFPNKRLQQLIEQLPILRSDVPSEVMQKIKFGNRIFVEHAADLVSILSGFQCFKMLNSIYAVEKEL